MIRRLILTIEILVLSLFIIGGSSVITQTAEARTSEFPGLTTGRSLMALGGLDGKEYLNSREGFLAMYNQGVRLFELDLSRTSDGVWVCRHNWNDLWSSGKAQEKKFLQRNSLHPIKYMGNIRP